MIAQLQDTIGRFVGALGEVSGYHRMLVIWVKASD